MGSSTPSLEPSWQALLSEEFEAPYMKELKAFLLKEKQAGKTIYPEGSNYFRALNSTPFRKVRVVIIGQDPYPGPGQACGLCFSVPRGIPIPRSLQNIYKELQSDLGIPPSSHGSLDQWAREGVLLLNSVLTVEKGRPASHQGRGWERFTDKIVAILNNQRRNLVFLLWGGSAQRKGATIDPNRHVILQAAHPSPYSARGGFFGTRPFSKTNQALKERGIEPVDWRLAEEPEFS